MTDWARANEAAAAIAAGWDPAGPGGAVVLFDGDGIRAEAAGGLADLAHGLPFRPDTAGRYASVTKHVFASLLLLDGGFDLDAPLGRYLPALDGAPAVVTVGGALDMTGGLPDTVETWKLLGGSGATPLGRDALLDFAQRVQGLNFAPGTEISYSNTGYRLLQAAVEARAGRPMRALLHERLAAPLDLPFVLPDDETEPVPGLAAGYWRDGDGRWRVGRYGPFISASGALAGSARTLALWLGALLRGRGTLAGVLDRLAAPRRLVDGRATGYGLGLAETRLGGHVFHGHGGSLPGYKDHFLLDRAAGTGVAVVTNREDADALGLACRVMAALTGAPLPEPAAALAPPGLYAAASGPDWAELGPDGLCFLGATQALHDGGDGWAASINAHLPMRLRVDGPAVVGEIGHLPRRLEPVPAAECEATWLGTWAAAEHHAGFTVARHDGGMALSIGAGPARAALPLQPIGAGRALFRQADGPAVQRACVLFENDEARLVTARSRVLRFRRAG